MSISQLARTIGEVRALLEAALSDGAPWFQLPTATIAAIVSCLDAKEAKLAEAKAVLERINEDNYNCPWPDCRGEKGLVPCAPDCRLAKVLR